MSDNYITNVLNMLRLLKRTGRYSGQSALQNIELWYPEGGSRSAQLRFAAYVVDQCDGAMDIINSSTLEMEAKTGLLQIVESLRRAFGIEGIQHAINSFIPQLDAALSTFAILASVYAAGPPPSENDDLKALIIEVEAMLTKFEEADLDGGLREIAKRHLHVLLTLLRNIDALGVDAAMVAYAELVVRLRRADANASSRSQENTATFWESIVSWGGRLTKISEAVSSGSKLLEAGQDLTQTLLGYGAN